MDDARGDTVHILMAVYNGAKTLPAQLASFEAQTHTDWHLVASDDGSKDQSRHVLDAFRTRTDTARVTIIDGPGQGAAANFLRLLRYLAQGHAPARWIAFSDQDDVWLPDKIARSVSALKASDTSAPTLYCSRTWVTCHELETRRISPARPRKPDFRNALVQNIAAGNTIVLNPAAVDLVLNAVRHVEHVVVHDWWLYQLITGAGGQVIHDDVPGLLYRQHVDNQIGINDTARARWYRMIQLLRGDFSMWNRANIAALRATANTLHPAHRATLEGFARLPSLPLIRRLRLFRQLRLYRQTWGGTLTLWLAVMFRLV